MKKHFLTVVYAIDDKPETVEAILAQRPWQAVAHTDALADLEHAQADLQAAADGYDAARLEIESLQTRIQELGQMARECSGRKVVQLESALAMHVRSGKDWAMRVEALERTITTLRAQITTRNAQVATAEKAMRELDSANSIALQLDARIKELEAQLYAIGAGGVEPLRKRCLHQISEPARPVFGLPGTRDVDVASAQRAWDAAQAQPAAQALDARWVSAKDRLPDPFCEVLIHPRPTDYCCEGSVNTQGEWSYGEYEHHFGHNSIKCNVTHWMPLPTPPVAIAAQQGGA